MVWEKEKYLNHIGSHSKFCIEASLPVNPLEELANWNKKGKRRSVLLLWVSIALRVSVPT